MMNSEENRLETFKDWPSNAPVSPSRIAKAGFYSINSVLSVECFACHVQIHQWDYGDQVMAKHKNANPTCPFVLDPTNSGNIPKVRSNEHPESLNNQNYEDESVRLASFQNWPIPHIVTPESLASAGFYYCNIGDNTKCAYCKGVMTSWVPEDDPDKEHKRHFPNCPFVISTITPRLLERFPLLNNVDLEGDDEDLDALGVHPHKIPKKPNMATLQSRLKTFENWPGELVQTPHDLSEAGFFYEGIGDQVRCFHCDGGLRHWDPDDDPWTEHARWFPLCSFVKILKGQDFINSSSNNCETKILTNNGTFRKSMKFSVTESILEEHMNTEIFKTALSIGLSVERLKRALKEKLEQTGTPFSHADNLVLATLNLQIDEEGRSEVESECTNSDYNEFSFDTKRNNGEDSSSEETSSKRLSLKEENRILKEQRLCKVCMDNEVGIVFLPCGHFATCVNCVTNLQDCPVCRTTIKATVRTFLA